MGEEHPDSANVTETIIGNNLRRLLGEHHEGVWNTMETRARAIYQRVYGVKSNANTANVTE
jgi:hypothetical protein